MAFVLNLINIKLTDQLEIMVFQIVLIIIFKSRLKEKVLHFDIFKFFNKTFVYGAAFTHLTKGFNQYLVKIPVYQIVFVLKISVKSLSGHTAGIADLLYGDLLDRRSDHTFLHGISQPVFYIVVHLIPQKYPL